MLLIGSKALRSHGIDPKRKTLDEDYICTIEQYHTFIKQMAPTLVHAYPLTANKMVAKDKQGNIFEFEIAWNEGKPTSADLLLEINTGSQIASLETLLMLKLSHRYLKNSPHFLKTLNDIKLLRAAGVTISDPMKKILKKREKETYVYKHPSLNQDKKSFFKDDGIQYMYEHDTIHLAVKHLDMPAYEYYKGDNAEVQCDKQKFFEVEERVRLFGVLEEVLVLALERSQIPNNFKIDPRWSFNKAHEKVCTSITSGFFREFAYDNWDAVQALYNADYVTRFQDGVKSGLVKYV